MLEVAFSEYINLIYEEMRNMKEISHGIGSYICIEANVVKGI